MKALLLSVSLLLPCLGYAQKSDPPKQLSAFKIESNIKIDGFLDEEEWQSAEAASGFMNFEPVPWETPSQKTEVKILFDDQSIYIGAFLWDDNPSGVLRQFSLRDDDRSNADQFTVLIDTYQGQQTASAFAVTAAGVQYDAQVFVGKGDSRNWDKVWDAVWDSDVRVGEKGWFVEMEIPYSALRFPEKEVQTWNINFTREIRRGREQAAWNHFDPEIGEQLIQMGQLNGIRDVQPPLRLSFTPYVAGIVKNNIDKSQSPVSDWNSEIGGGIDLKYGINQAFTLDMTLVPDFSEVQSDDAVLNLGPFEVAFAENRPFFTEGTELFNKNSLFYSRRVGGVPRFYSDAEEGLDDGETVTNNPRTAQLINATKLTGRNKSGLGIGLFNAIEGETYASIQNADKATSRKVKTGPLTNYNMLIFDQLLANGSNVYGMNTNVWREGSYYDANVTGAGFKLRNKAQSYELNAFGALSQIYDAEVTDLGHSYNFSVNKISGNWTGSLGANVESDNYEINDLGLLLSPNEQSYSAGITYNDFNGYKKIAAWRVGLNSGYTRLFDPNVFADFAINFDGFARTRSFNAFGFNGRYEPVETYDYFDPRTSDFSRYLPYPVNYMFTGWVSTDYRKPFALDFRLGTRQWYTTEDRYNVFVKVEPRFRFNDHFSMIMSVGQEALFADRGFVRNTDDDQIIMGDRDRNILINTLNANYIFNDKIGLALRIRHYWSTVEYLSYYRLSEDSELLETNYTGLDSDGNSVDNVSQSFFNLDCVLRWRFAPGSDLIFTWKTAISPSDDLIDQNYWQEAESLIDVPIRNSFTLKALYFHDWSRMQNIWKGKPE